MHDDEIFRFKLQLMVGLITPKEIQDWVNKKFLADSSNQLLLDICFLRTEDELKQFILSLSDNSLKLDREQIALKTFKKYFDDKLPKVLDKNIDHHIENLLFIADYLDDLSELRDEPCVSSYIIAFHDQIIETYDGHIQMSSEQAYLELYEYLKKWISIFYITH